MIHQKMQDLFSAHLDGVLSPAEEADLQLHLASCPDCRRELSRLVETVESFQSLPDIPLPEGFTLQLHEKLLQAAPETDELNNHRQKKSIIQRLAASPWISLGAAAALIFMVWTAYHPLLLNSTGSDLAVQPSLEQKAVSDEASSLAIQTQPTVPAAETPAAAEKTLPAPVLPDATPAADEFTDGQESSPAELPKEEQPAAAAVVAPSVSAEKAVETVDQSADQSQTAAQSAAQGATADTAPEGPQMKMAVAPVLTDQSAAEQSMAATSSPLLVQTAKLTLTVPGTSFATISEGIGALYVIDRTDEPKGLISLQVPTGEWDQAMKLLMELGAVANLQLVNNDLTAVYQDTMDQLSALSQQGADLATKLAASGSIEEKLDLEIQSHRLAGEISGLEEQLRFLDEKQYYIALDLVVQGMASPDSE